MATYETSTQPESEGPPLPAKLLGPRATEAIARLRLYRALDLLTQKAVTWIHAPAGAGKSTLLATYLASRRIPVLWYNVDGDDADPSAAYHHLRVGADHLLGRPSHLPAPAPGPPAAQRAFAARYFDTLVESLPRPAFVVLDDYQHAVDAPAWNELFGSLCASAAGRVPILVASRVAPPVALARLCGTGELQVLDWSSLRLDEGEVAEILQREPGRGNGVDSAELWALTDGWAVAVAMLARSTAVRRATALGRPVAHTWSQGGARTQGRRVIEQNHAVFQDLAREILDGLPADTKRLLLSLAVMPTFTPTMVARLTGSKDALSQLASLYEDHLLVERHGEHAFRIHDLIRSFLVAHGRAERTDGWREVSVRAATLLAEDGQFGPAIDLLTEAQAWQSLGDVVERHGPMLASQARFSTIGSALEALPAEQRGARPWLLYWQSVVALGHPDGGADGLAQRAFDGFRAARDPIGARLAWALAIEATVLAGTDFGRFGDWITTLAGLEAFDAPPPVTLRVVMSELLAYSFWNQATAEATDAARRALEIVGRCGSPEDRVRVGGGALLVYAIGGHQARAEDMRRLAREDFERAGQNPLPKLAYLHSEAILAMHTGRLDGARSACEQGLALARASGIDGWTGSLLMAGTMTALARGDHAAAEQLLSELGAAVVSGPPFASTQYAYGRAWLAFERGELEVAGRWLGDAERESESLGFRFGRCQQLIARVVFEGARGDAAAFAHHARRLDALVDERVSPLLAPTAGLGKAYGQLALGEVDDALVELRAGLEALRRRAMPHPWFLSRTVIARLATTALEHEIEPEVAARLVRDYEIVPGREASAIAAWPWAVRIRVFGGLDVEVDNRALQFGRKPPTVLLTVLKVLAVSPEPLSAARLTSLVWPEGEDVSRGSLDTALYRLRKLLGIDAAIESSNAGISLAGTTCWTDVRAFELVCDRIATMAREGTRSVVEIQRCEQRLLELYRGPLGDADDPPVVLRARDRLARGRARAIADLGRLWTEAGDPARCQRLAEMDAAR